MTAGGAVQAAIDRSIIGRALPTVSATVELAALQQFARAIGETDALYFDPEVARSRGYRAVPAPPTYIVCLKHAVCPPEGLLATLGVEGGSGKLLHAEQSFEFQEPACAGDRLSFAERVADVYERKGGLLQFIVLETTVRNQDARHVAVIRHTEVLRTDA
jgi:acyl dehydratase